VRDWRLATHADPRNHAATGALLNAKLETPMLHVIWIDSQRAEICRLDAGGRFEHSHLVGREIDHHTHSHREDMHPADKLFRTVARALQGAEHVLVVGPGPTKMQFKSWLERHHAADLAARLLGVEAADHLTEAQLQALALRTAKQRLPAGPDRARDPD
jgi:stalled ribosome rescue protein Dom34